MFICAGLQTQPEGRRLELKLNFRLLSSSQQVSGYLFCDAQCSKAICSVQVQVGLSPVDNLLQAFPFGVTFENSRAEEWMDGCLCCTCSNGFSILDPCYNTDFTRIQGNMCVTSYYITRHPD